MVYYNWGSRSSETAYNRVPASWLEGKLSGFGSTMGDERQRRFRSSRATPVEPPPYAAKDINNMAM